MARRTPWFVEIEHDLGSSNINKLQKNDLKQRNYVISDTINISSNAAFHEQSKTEKRLVYKIIYLKSGVKFIYNIDWYMIEFFSKCRLV